LTVGFYWNCKFLMHGLSFIIEEPMQPGLEAHVFSLRSRGSGLREQKRVSTLRHWAKITFKANFVLLDRECWGELETLRLWRSCLKLKIVIAQPPFTRGPSEVFRIVDDQDASNTKLCHGIDSCFAATPSGHSGQ
jgi:hypothetical protein